MKAKKGKSAKKRRWQAVWFGSCHPRLKEWLTLVLDEFTEDNISFYLGGIGGFDKLAASVVQEKKKHNPKLQSILIIPYLNRACDEENYDYTIYPPLETVPLRFAISKRNEWMVEQADVVIAYVTHSWGGAANTLAYAKRKKKKIIMYTDTPPT